MPHFPPSLSISFLTTIRNTPNLPYNTWYLLAGVTLSALNRADKIPGVFAHALETGPGVGQSAPRKGIDGTGRESSAKPDFRDQQVMARRMREALIKTTVIGGLPKAINALLALKTATPPELLDSPLSASPTLRPVDIFDVPSSTVLHRGQAFFDRIYGKVSKRVMGQMDRCGTEDLGLTARLMYGYLLSNTMVLSAAESSLVLLAGLIPQDIACQGISADDIGQVNPQLKGHLKGAVNNGASVEEVRAVREVVIQICESEGMKRLGEREDNGWGWHTDVATL